MDNCFGKGWIKKVAQYDLNGVLIKVWDSIADAKKYCEGQTPYNIVECCKGRLKSSGGYQWKYFEGSYSNIDRHTPKRPIIQYSREGTVVRTWPFINM